MGWGNGFSNWYAIAIQLHGNRWSIRPGEQFTRAFHARFVMFLGVNGVYQEFQSYVRITFYWSPNCVFHYFINAFRKPAFTIHVRLTCASSYDNTVLTVMYVHVDQPWYSNPSTQPRSYLRSFHDQVASLDA